MKLLYGVHFLILIIMLAFSEIRAQGAEAAMDESGQASAQFGMGATGAGDGAGKAQSAAAAGMNMGAGVSGAFGAPAIPSDR
uniref:Uncharacterized protein n=1 Tax=Glossina pallidipes TaxID=7398 RepID=A0A1A9Z2S3_GLOPL